METLSTLDAHSHIRPDRSSDELTESGAVLAMTCSLEGAELAVNRRDSQIIWGAGCHPRLAKAQASFNLERFKNLATQTALVGEIGLDVGSYYRRSSLETQLQTLRKALKVVADMPRIVSIHGYQATDLVIKELQQTPVTAPILHWWTGNVEETREAVKLGCYFSLHSAVARQSKFRTTVPRERILVETDHGINDPPAAIPCRIEWVEHLVAQQIRLNVTDVRRLVWQNFASIVKETGTGKLLPEKFRAMIAEVDKNAGHLDELAKK